MQKQNPIYITYLDWLLVIFINTYDNQHPNIAHIKDSALDCDRFSDSHAKPNTQPYIYMYMYVYVYFR